MVKIFVKRVGADTADALETARKQVAETSALIQEQAHAIPYDPPELKSSAGFLTRPYLFTNLFDRLSSRPLLSLAEKRWIAFQLIVALDQIHSTGVRHGDIKIDNVVLTSWNWVYLTDFASFKPAQLPSDNPAAFSFFYDTAGRRTCCIAPERFYATESGAADALCRQGELTAAMDIFSLGCVLAELFTDGTPLFDLASLLAYRESRFDPQRTLAKIQQAELRELITTMIALDPASRPSAAALLQQSRNTIFPEYFASVLHPFLQPLAQRVAPPSPDLKVINIKERWSSLESALMSESADTKADAFVLVCSAVCSYARHLTITSAKLTAIELLMTIGQQVRK